MAETFIGRQPICRRNAGLAGYDLILQDSELAHPAFKDADTAAARAVVDDFVDIALGTVAGKSRGVVEVTQEFLLSPFVELLPKERVVLEIPQDLSIDDVLLKSVAQLSKKGYWFALDGYVGSDQSKSLAKFVKWAKLDVQHESWDAVATRFFDLKKLGLKLLASNVETRGDYEFSEKLGFDLYQGFYFCKPDPTVAHKKIPFDRISTLHLLAKLQDPNISPRELEQAVGQNIALTYRLLRYLNSPIYAFPKKIESIGHAASLVGTRLLSSWASLALLGSIENKPQELMVTGMVRAHMCQQLGSALHQDKGSQFFTVGLLSVVDALMDRPMWEALMLLPMTDEIKSALVQRSGLMGEALNCVQSYERGDWGNTRFATLDKKTIRDAYLSSLTLTRGMTQEFSA